MATGSKLTDRIAGLIPNSLAWPLSALSTLAGFAGAALLFTAAALGSITAASWSAVAFAAAAVFWHLSDYAESNRS
ncbi:MAG: hypothetical protein V3V29_10130 [Acidimicrobiia bacterium]